MFDHKVPESRPDPADVDTPDAVLRWYWPVGLLLEFCERLGLPAQGRKEDPDVRREIAECNTFLQYLRDIRDAHQELGLDDARRCRHVKSRVAAQDGKVVYAPEDLSFLQP